MRSARILRRESWRFEETYCHTGWCEKLERNNNNNNKDKYAT